MAFASWWYATQGDKKTSGASKPAEKKVPDAAEKKPGSSKVGEPAGASGTSKTTAAQQRTMKPADTTAKVPPKVEPVKPTEPAKPKGTSTEAAAKPHELKSPTKQDCKKASKASSVAAGKVAAGAAAAGAVAVAVASSKPKDGAKEQSKKVSVDKVSAPALAPKAEFDDALDELVDSLGGPENVPESPKFTGPEIKDTTFTAEYLEELGKRESSIPPEYRHLLDGKGDKVPLPEPKEPKKSLGDDDLVAAFSSDFASCQVPPGEKKPKLEEKKEKTVSAAASQSVSSAVSKPTSRSVSSSVSKPVSSTAGKPSSEPKGTSAVPSGAAPAKLTVIKSPTKQDCKKADSKAKEEMKKVSVDRVSAAAAPPKADFDDALDELIDSLGGPENVPESPKFTGPEIKDTTVTAEYLEELGKRESSIPPEYRDLLDGKGDAPPPEPKEPKKSLRDDDLVAAFSSDFASCQAPPDEKKPKLEEKKDAKPISAAASQSVSCSVSKPVSGAASQPVSSATSQPVSSATSQPSSENIPEDALDELMGTLEGPTVNVPESPVFTGPEITETIVPTYLEELGKRESSIPPAYRNLLDGKDDGNTIAPTAPPEEELTMTDLELADEFSKDFTSCPSSVQTAPAVKPKDPKTDKESKSGEIVASSASSVQAAAAAASSSAIDDALDELIGTLEGPDLTVPDSPVYTGPEITETSTEMHIEELGKRESSIPPKYRHLLDGKDDGKPAPPPPPAEKPIGEDELIDAFDKEFGGSACPAVQPTPPAKPKDSSQDKKPKTDEVVSSTCSAVQSAPVSSKPAAKVDPLDALAGSLGVRQDDPKDKKPAVDKVKEKTGRENKEKLGEDENTIPPDYRLQEVKDKDGKPILPKPEEKPQPMSEDDLLDALTEGFDTSPATPAKTAPLKPPAKDSKQSSGSEEVVSCSTVSAVRSAAPKPSEPEVHIPDDALDLLSGSLGSREADPDENKPVVDVVKEKAKSEHIDRLGDRDDTIPPDYRHLLDGRDEGKPAQPAEKVTEKPKKPENSDSAIDALSGSFASCETSSTAKSQPSSQGKCEKSSPSAPVSQCGGKATDSAKSTKPPSSDKPGAQKPSKS
ncbi:calpastatin isoform 2-T2 [Discoglossus pictus]